MSEMSYSAQSNIYRKKIRQEIRAGFPVSFMRSPMQRKYAVKAAHGAQDVRGTFVMRESE